MWLLILLALIAVSAGLVEYSLDRYNIKNLQDRDLARVMEVVVYVIILMIAFLLQG